MSDINFSDFFDFNDNSQIEKGKAGIKELDKAFHDFISTINSFSMANFAKETRDYTRAIQDAANASRQLSITNTAHQQALTRNLAAIQQATAAQAALNSAQRGGTTVMNAVGTSVDGLKARLKQLEATYNKLSDAERAVRGEKLAKKYQLVQQEIKELTAALKTGATTVQAAAGSYNALDAETKKLIKDLKAMGDGVDRNNPIAKRMQEQIRKNTEQMKEFDKAMGQNFRNVGNYQSALNGLKGGLGNLVASYISLTTVVAGFQKVFDLTVKLDGIRASLEFVTGSNIQASATFEFLSRAAQDLGLNLESVIAGYQKLAGATFGTNFQGEKTRDIFLAVAKASAVLRVSAADTEGVMKALGQIISKGKVQAEELRGQLGDRMSGAFNLFAKGLGVTTAELDKLLKKGEVTSDSLIQFADQLNKTFDPGVAKSADTLTGSINRLSNVFTDMIAKETNLGKFFKFFIDRTADMAKQIAGLVNSRTWNEFFNRVGTTNVIKTDIEQNAKYGSQKSLDDVRSVVNKAPQTVTKDNLPEVGQAIQDAIILKDNAMKAIAGMNKEIKKGNIKLSDDIVQTSAKNYQNAADLARAYIRQVQGDFNKLSPKNIDSAAEEKAEKERKRKEKADAKAQRDAERALKERLKKAEDLVKAETDKLLAELDVKLANDLVGKTEDEAVDYLIRYEQDRYKIIVDGLEVRQKIYKDDKAKFAEFEADKTKAVATRMEKINQIEEDYAKRAAERRKKIREYENQVVDIQNDSQDGTARNNIERSFVGRTGPSAGIDKTNAIYGFERNKALQGYLDLLLKKTMLDQTDLVAQAQINVEIEKQLALLQSLGEENLLANEAFASEQRLALIRATYDGIREMSDRFLADNPMKYIFDSVLTYIEEFNDQTKSKMEQWAGLIIGATDTVNAAIQQGSEARIKQLEIEKERELELAGNNTKAKEAIEKQYQKKIAQERRKAAIAERVAALFEIAVNTAVGASKVVGQSGIFGLPLVPIVIALGALQTAAVLAAPLPKYKTGRKGGPEEWAIVGDGGPELIESKGRFHYAEKEQVVRLGAGDKVHTATETKKIFEKWTESSFSDKVVNSFLAGTQVVKSANEREKRDMIQAFVESRFSPKDMEKAMSKAISGLPIQQLFIDEKGARTYQKTVNGRIQDTNSRNSMGGIG